MSAVSVFAAAAIFLSGCTSSDPAPEDGSFPEVEGVEVEGSFGEEPTLSFNGDAPEELSRTLLTEGDGETVQEGDLVIINYLGQTFDGDVFDSSFESTSPLSFTPGQGGVISGLEKTVEGVTEGSRVVITVPPEEGYGDDVSETAGFGADDILVFVFDVLSTTSPDASISPDATVTDESYPGVTVSGALGDPATIEIDPESALPSEDKAVVLATGSGDPVKDGLVVVNFASSNWSGEQSLSTWEEGGPQGLTVGETGEVLDQLVGVPLGSRVLLVFAPLEDDAEPSSTAVAVVVDLIEQP